jgi:hypothetical protein
MVACPYLPMPLSLSHIFLSLSLSLSLSFKNDALSAYSVSLNSPKMTKIPAMAPAHGESPTWSRFYEFISAVNYKQNFKREKYNS